MINKINILDNILFSRVMLIKVINIFKLNMLIYKINNYYIKNNLKIIIIIIIIYLLFIYYLFIIYYLLFII